MKSMNITVAQSKPLRSIHQPQVHTDERFATILPLSNLQNRTLLSKVAFLPAPRISASAFIAQSLLLVAHSSIACNAPLSGEQANNRIRDCCASACPSYAAFAYNSTALFISFLAPLAISYWCHNLFSISIAQSAPSSSRRKSDLASCFKRRASCSFCSVRRVHSSFCFEIDSLQQLSCSSRAKHNFCERKKRCKSCWRRRM